MQKTLRPRRAPARKIWAPKRQIVWHTARQARLLKFLQGELQKPGFFRGLLETIGTPKVRKFVFDGTPVAIKNTKGFAEEGRNYAKLRQNFLKHQFAVRNGRIKAQFYKLKSPRVYGVIGNYLVMEFVAEKPILDFLPADEKKAEEIKASCIKAIRELEENIKQINKAAPKPQVTDIMIAGNTNPKEPLKGKWIFFMPYDYV